jgi:hypothetical protein
VTSDAGTTSAPWRRTAAATSSCGSAPVIR